MVTDSAFKYSSWGRLVGVFFFSEFLFFLVVIFSVFLLYFLVIVVLTNMVPIKENEKVLIILFLLLFSFSNTTPKGKLESRGANRGQILCLRGGTSKKREQGKLVSSLNYGSQNSVWW